MAAIKPKLIRKDLAPGAVPDSTPEVAVREYFLSRCEEQRSKRMPEWDAPPQNPSTDLVVARRDLEDADTKLADKWEQSKQYRRSLDAQWDDLRSEEEALRQAFVQYNKLVKENRDKRLRAESKIGEQRELQNWRDAQAQELEQKVEDLSAARDTMKQHVDQHSIYERYLKDVVSDSREFSTVFDVLKRYEALNAARSELTARQEQAMVALEQANSNMNKMSEEKTQVIMGLNNQLANLQSRYDLTKAEALCWESALSHIKNTTAEKALELERVRTACWSMYQSICKRRDTPVLLNEDDVEEQLATIKRTIQELKRILRIARRRATKEVASK